MLGEKVGMKGSSKRGNEQKTWHFWKSRGQQFVREAEIHSKNVALQRNKRDTERACDL